MLDRDKNLEDLSSFYWNRIITLWHIFQNVRIPPHLIVDKKNKILMVI